MKVCVVGLGLLGGSFSLKLKLINPDVKIIGVDCNEENGEKALELGIADELVDFEEGIKIADLVVLATPVNVLLQQLISALHYLKEGATLMDLGSTKAELCRIADTHPRRGRYVAAHPIAGTENSGPEAAFSGLLERKTIIVCDRQNSDKDALEFVEDLFKNLEMKVLHMKANDHDRHIAYVSHLSHISSFALGSTVLDIEKDERTIFAMAGSGFSSTARLAKSSPGMWAPILTQNRKNIIKALDAYIDKLQHFRSMIDNEDEDGSYNLMKETNNIRRVLKGKRKDEE
ncbi:prephenate dehydrogenase [Bacteroidota bacterium]